MLDQKATTWGPTENGLRLYSPTGEYYINRRFQGGLINVNTHQTTIKKARVWMEDYFANLRNPEKVPSPVVKPVVTGYTLDQAVAGFHASMETKQRQGRLNSPKAILYRNECLVAIKKHWPELATLDLSKITQDEVAAFQERIAKAYSGTRHNGIMQNLRALFEVMVATKVIKENPARKFIGHKISTKELILPTDAQFLALIDHIEKHANSKGRRIALTAKFIAMTGARISAAGKLLKANVDFTTKTIHFPRHIMKYQHDVVIPMWPELEELCRQIAATDNCRGQHFLPIARFQRSLTAATKALNMPRMTHHDLRHFAASKLLQHLKPHDVAEILGHGDHGATVIKNYSHIFKKYHQDAVMGVRFFAPTPATVTEAKSI